LKVDPKVEEVYSLKYVQKFIRWLRNYQIINIKYNINLNETLAAVYILCFIKDCNIW